jgi:hypothetical protein
VPDLELLPPGRYLPVLPLDAQALPTIRERAHRRRTRRAVGVGSGALALAVGAWVALGPLAGSGQESLLPPAGHPSVVSGLLDAPGPVSTTTSGPTSVGEQYGHGHAVSSQSHRRTTTTRRTPTTLTQPSSRGAVHKPDPPATRLDPTGVNRPVNCGRAGSETVPGWCIIGQVGKLSLLDGQQQGQSLRLAVCRSENEVPGSLSWSSNQEVGFRVVDRGGQVVWTYRPAVQHYKAARQESVLTGDCVAWELMWDRRDDSDRLVPPGSYTLEAWTTAAPVSGVRDHQALTVDKT